MNKPKLSDREAAFVEAARRELTGLALHKRQPAAAGAPPPGPASPAGNPAPANAARPAADERIAALMQAEQEESSKRRKRLRQFGIVIPALILAAAALWIITAIFRYARI